MLVLIPGQPSLPAAAAAVPKLMLKWRVMESNGERDMECWAIQYHDYRNRCWLAFSDACLEELGVLCGVVL